MVCFFSVVLIERRENQLFRESWLFDNQKHLLSSTCDLYLSTFLARIGFSIYFLTLNANVVIFMHHSDAPESWFLSLVVIFSLLLFSLTRFTLCFCTFAIQRMRMIRMWRRSRRRRRCVSISSKISYFSCSSSRHFLSLTGYLMVATLKPFSG